MAVTYLPTPLVNDQSQSGGGVGLDTASSITIGLDQKIWFTIPSNNDNGAIASLDPATGVVTRYKTPASASSYYALVPRSIVAAPGGDLWFIDATHVPYNYNQIAYQLGSLDPTTGVIVEYPIGDFASNIGGLAADPAGNLWFTDTGHGSLGRFDATTHAITTLPIDGGNDFPNLIVPGPGGDLYFTAVLQGSSIQGIGRLDPTTSAIEVTPFPNARSNPIAITAGPDGNIWFNDAFYNSSPRIGMYNPATRAITEYAGGSYGGITTGPDGNLWSTGQGGLTSFNPTTHVTTTYPFTTALTIPQVGGPTIGGGPGNSLSFIAQGYIVSARIVPANEVVVIGTVGEDPTGSGQFAYPRAYQSVYLDLDGNGRPDPAEPTTRTDAQGTFTFLGLAPGSYTVRVLAYPGTTVTSPAGGGLAVTVAPGEVGTAGTFGIIRNSSLLPLTYQADPFGTGNPDVQTAEVIGLYRLILGRDPEPLGGSNAVAYLKGGGSLSQLSGDLLTSVEYDNNLVASYYRNYLDRAPTASEQSDGTAFLRAGGNGDTLAASLLGSTEFSTLHAGDAAFVEALYHVILGRNSEPAGKADWVARLAGGLTRSAVIAKFLVSNESDGRSVGGMNDIILGQVLTSPVDSIATLRKYGSKVVYAVNLITIGGFVSRANASVAT